jgi:hypothetical protein
MLISHDRPWAARWSASRILMKPLLIAALVLTQLGSAGAADVCSQRMPSDLKLFITARYPDRLLPAAEQTEPDDLKYSVEHGGTGCLRMAAADVDGDGRMDYAALLVSRTKTTDTDFVVFVRRKVAGTLIASPMFKTWQPPVFTSSIARQARIAGRRRTGKSWSPVNAAASSAHARASSLAHSSQPTLLISTSMEGGYTSTSLIDGGLTFRCS